DVVGHAQHHLAHVLHVAILVHHHHALGEHRLPHGPYAVHHFARVPGIRLADRHDHQVVEDGFDRQVHVHDLRQRDPHERQKDALDGLAYPGVFHGRLAHDGGCVDRLLAVRHASNVEDGIEVFERVEAGVVAEGAFAAEFVQVDVALEDDFCRGRDFQVHGLALHQLHRLLAQEAGNHELLDVGRRGDDGSEGQRGLGADGDRDLHLAFWALADCLNRTTSTT